MVATQGTHSSRDLRGNKELELAEREQEKLPATHARSGFFQ